MAAALPGSLGGIKDSGGVMTVGLFTHKKGLAAGVFLVNIRSNAWQADIAHCISAEARLQRGLWEETWGDAILAYSLNLPGVGVRA